jgi:hypothetical protein
MFRGTQLDIDDCLDAFAASKMDPEALLERYAEAAKYDLNPDKMIGNFIIFAEALVEKSMVNQSFLEKVASYK